MQLLGRRSGLGGRGEPRWYRAADSDEVKARGWRAGLPSGTTQQVPFIGGSAYELQDNIYAVVIRATAVRDHGVIAKNRAGFRVLVVLLCVVGVAGIETRDQVRVMLFTDAQSRWRH